MNFLAILGLSLLSLPAISNSAPLDSPLSDSLFVLQAELTDTAPVIDGVLEDSIWARAAVATSFIQYEPERGQPSSMPSRAYVLYDEANLYVAFRLEDTQSPTAQLTRRDANLLNDDSVILILDSFNDGQSAYYFMTNVLGTQTDGRIANDGRTVDATWDANWETASRRYLGGWSVEMKIPLTSIKYSAGENQTWGINLGRSRRRTLELSYWAGPLENSFRVSQGGSLIGLNVAPPLKRYQAIVYGLSSIEQSGKDAVIDGDAGGDLSYAITTETSAYATINPDFATIEADREQINLTRFELFLPEKRPFFLEGAELFKQRIRTFYSRRILDITAGGRVLGQSGPYTFSFLGTHAPPIGEVGSAIYGVGRVQRSIWGSSNVALTVTNRALENARVQTGSAGLDATLFFSKTLGMTGQLVQSWGAFREGTWGYFIRPSLDTPIWHFHFRYTHLGENFGNHVNAVGFVRDDDRREVDSALERIFWFQDRMLERVTYDSNYNAYWSQEGTLRSWQIDQAVDVQLRNLISAKVAFSEEFKRFEKDFRNRQTTLTLGYNTRAFESVSVSYRFGKNFDADFQLWIAAAAYKITPQLSVAYQLQRLLLDPDPNRSSTWIHVVSIDQFFTPDLFFRLFFQTNSSIDRRNVQARFVYRYKPPFGTVQVAYQRGTAAFGQASDQGNTLFLKVTGVF